MISQLEINTSVVPQFQFIRENLISDKVKEMISILTMLFTS